jgi:Flp pilus assembly protein TadD
MEVDKVVGVCMLMRRTMLEEIGLFDTRFGIGNFEDDDICLRARMAGYKVLWAKDAFVHHEGSRTFRSIDVDYGGLMEENRGKFAAKWAPVAAMAGLCPNPGSPGPGAMGSDEPGSGHSYPSSGPPVILLAREGGRVLAETLEWLKDNSPGPAYVAGGAAGLPDGVNAITPSEGQSIPAAILRFAETCGEQTLFFLSEGAVVTPDWASPLEALLSVEDVGCAASSSNAGWGLQLMTPTYAKTGKPLVKFARRNSLEHRGRVENLDAAFPAAIAVRRNVLLRAGMADEFQTGAMLVDFQRRLGDSGLRVVCAKDSYVHLENGWDAEAEVECGAAIKLKSAGNAARAGDAGSAISDLEGALALKPDYVEAHYQMGVLLALAGRPAEARSEFEKVINMDPGDSRAMNNLGCLLFEAGKTAEAESAFTSSLQVDGGNWEAKRNLADLCISTGRAQEGMDLYHALLVEHNDRPEIHTSLARVFASLGDAETAATLLKSAMRLAPGDDTIRKALEAVGAAAVNPEEGDILESR